jgi:hypothetical protein
MLQFIILVALVIAFMIAKSFYQQWQDNKLRDNPPPKRVIEVSLPRDISDSRLRMAKFWRKVASAAQGDAKARKMGARQLDFVYHVTVPAPGATPEMKCLIYADPDKMDGVKRSIKQVFDGTADVLELEEDPLGQLAQVLRKTDEGGEPEEVTPEITDPQTALPAAE